MSDTTDVVMIGAGAAGLMAAIHAAEHGARVIVCERMQRPGLKLCATGGGRCNLTVDRDVKWIVDAFGRNGRFMRSALAEMDPVRLRGFFANLDCPTVSPDELHVYPKSDSARDVCQALLDRCRALGVEIRCAVAVRKIALDDGAVCGVVTDNGSIDCARVILAAGGKGYSDLGSDGSGFTLAERVGHTVVEPTPALVPLVVEEDWVSGLAGIAVPVSLKAEVKALRKKELCGELLFTHRGISGPVVLDVSGEIAAQAPGHPVRIHLKLLPDIADRWPAWFDKWRVQEGRKHILSLLSQRLPARFADVLLKRCDVPRNATAATLRKDDRRRLLDALTGLPLTVTGSEGWSKAMVTRGGVSLKEVHPQSMQSRLVRGLHVAGEVLDLDGPCGGYNLTWAFSSGALAGRSAAEGV